MGHYSLTSDRKYRSSSGRNFGGARTSFCSSQEPAKRRQSSPAKIPHHSGKGSASQHPDDNPKDPARHTDPENVEGKLEVKLDVLSPKPTTSQLTVLHGFQSRNISPAVEDSTSSRPRKSGQKTDEPPTEPGPVDSGPGRRISAPKGHHRASRGTVDRPPQGSTASMVRTSVDDEEGGARRSEEASPAVDSENVEIHQGSHGAELGVSKSSDYTSARKKPVAARRWISPAERESDKPAQNKKEPKDNNEQPEN